jgi:hypothetical protein
LTPHAGFPSRGRRPDIAFLEVELADGNRWALALPGPRLCPLVRHEPDEFHGSSVRVEFVSRVGYSLQVRRLWDEVASACERDDEPGVADAFRRVTLALLHAAHDIEASEAETLLDRDRVDLDQIARALIPAVFGVHVQCSARDGR